MDPDRARELLTAELTELDDRARSAAEDREQNAEPERDGAVSQHPGDHGSDVTSAMDAELLVETVAAQRRSVQQALDRLDEGCYGTCAVCGTDIDDERLEARPESVTCREHADTPVRA